MECDEHFCFRQTVIAIEYTYFDQILKQFPSHFRVNTKTLSHKSEEICSCSVDVGNAFPSIKVLKELIAICQYYDNERNIHMFLTSFLLGAALKVE